MTKSYWDCREHLIDLLRCYGNRFILVMINQDGKEIKLFAKSFVRQQLLSVGIMFPYDDGGLPPRRQANPTLDDNTLSVVFNEALFDFQVAYIEQFCVNKPQAQYLVDAVRNWINQKQEWLSHTFPGYENEEILPFLDNTSDSAPEEYIDPEIIKNDLKTLNEMGYESIDSKWEMKQLLWDFAIRRTPIGRLMKLAIKSITTDKKARFYLINNYRNLNSIIQKRIDEGEVIVKDKALEKRVNQITAEANKRVKTIKTQLQQKFAKDKKKWKPSVKISRNLKTILMNPCSKIHDAYDLTKEDDISRFLSWFAIWQRSVPDRLIRGLEKRRYQEPGLLDLFKEKVEKHNEKYAEILEEDDDEIESEELFTEMPEESITF